METVEEKMVRVIKFKSGRIELSDSQTIQKLWRVRSGGFGLDPEG